MVSQPLANQEMTLPKMMLPFFAFSALNKIEAQAEELVQGNQWVSDRHLLFIGDFNGGLLMFLNLPIDFCIFHPFKKMEAQPEELVQGNMVVVLSHSHFFNSKRLQITMDQWINGSMDQSVDRRCAL